MTVNTRLLQLFMHARPEEHYIQIHASLRLQVIPNIEALPHCQRHQSAAFIASNSTLIVWEDEPARLIERAEYIQDALMKMSWKNEDQEGETDEKGDGKRPFVEIEEYESREEEAAEAEKPRELVLWQTIYSGMTLTLVISALGAGWRLIAIEHVQDPNWIRLAFAAALPAQIWLSLVCQTSTINHAVVLTRLVFLPGHRRKYRSADRTRWTDGKKHQVLFWKSATSVASRHFWAAATRHYPDACLQRRSPRSHRAHCPFHQASHVNIRAAGWYCQHLHQRRWNAAYLGRRCS